MDVQMQDASPVTGVQPTPSLATSLPGSSSLTPATPAASSGALDAAKLDAIRKATLHSYKNKFLNLRDKFDKINATNVEYTNTLASAKKKEESMQEEINMLLDYLAEHAASDPELSKCLNPPIASSKVQNGV